MREKGNGWSSPSNVIALLAVLVTITVATTTINASYDLYGKGSAPPKSLEATYRSPVDPLTDLRLAKDQFTVTIQSGRDKLTNLKLRQAILQNDGKAPILPGDIFEAISIRTAAPWRIVSVVDATAKNPSAVQFDWERNSETEFRAKKALLNPGDYIALTVYLTDTSITNSDAILPAESAKAEDDPPLEWHTRVSNLQSIKVAPTTKADEFLRVLGPIQVVIWGWGVPFVIFSFMCFFSLYVATANAMGFLSGSLARKSVILLPASLMSLMAAEAGTTYVFGPWPFLSVKIDHLLNAPLVIVNAAALSVSVWATMRRLRKPNSVEVERS